MYDLASSDGWTNAVPVVLLEHAEVAVAQLVGDLLDGHSRVGHETRSRVPEEVGGPPSVELGSGGDPVELVAHRLRVRRTAKG